jgi:hypothetical protein
LHLINFYRFSKHKGYGSNFKFDSNYEDQTKFDNDNEHLNTQIVAIDALMNPNDMDKKCITREIIKCNAGFSKWSNVENVPLCTGI